MGSYSILYIAIAQAKVGSFPLGWLDADRATQSLCFQAKFKDLNLITLLYGSFPSL